MIKRIPLFLRAIENAQYLRKHQTHAESILWTALRNRRLGGVKFRRQHPFEQFIFDFFCMDLSLIIEIDGPVHLNSNQQDRDTIRDEHLEMCGF